MKLKLKTKKKSENCINLLSDKQDSRTWSMRPVLYVVCSSSELNEVTNVYLMFLFNLSSLFFVDYTITIYTYTRYALFLLLFLFHSICVKSIYVERFISPILQH